MTPSDRPLPFLRAVFADFFFFNNGLYRKTSRRWWRKKTQGKVFYWLVLNSTTVNKTDKNHCLCGIDVLGAGGGTGDNGVKK